MMHSDFGTTFSGLVHLTDKQLWKAYDAALQQECGVPVRFPDKGGDKGPRVSEQEARLMLAINLADAKFTCAIEVPTQQTYAFSGGERKRRALTDLAVYAPPPSDELLCNVEFKSGGTSTKRKAMSEEKRGPIEKDIEKLLREPGDGYWFHTLKRVDGKTIGKLWKVFAGYLRKHALNKNGDIPNKSLTFHFTVLDPGFSAEYKLSVVHEKIGNDWLQDVDGFNYSVSESKGIEYDPQQVWEVVEKQTPTQKG